MKNPKTLTSSNKRTEEACDSLAISALGFLAQDPERLQRFLDLSGLDVQTLRSAAQDPVFLEGVMSYILGDEGLLLALADHIPIAPERIANAFSKRIMT